MLVLLGMLPSALAQFLQIAYQRYAARTHAAMIYALKPLFAYLIAAAILGERMRPLALLGGGLMVVSAMAAPCLARR